MALGRLLLSNPDIILLDEPTNHLDMESIAWLETYLLNYPGAVFIVSHDRYFLDKVADRILELDHGKLTEYLGNYSYYKEKKQDLEAIEKDRNGKEEEEEKEKEEKPRENEHQVKTEVSAADVSKLSHVEMEIGRLEATMKMYTVQMSMNPEKCAELADEYEEAKKKLDKLYAKWDELAEKTES